MSNKKFFAIGDIHGCAEELEELLAKLPICDQSTVVFLGDYVDRGPDSRNVIDQIIKLQKKCRVVALRGNHESMFIDFLEKPDSSGAALFILNGGGSTLASYSEKEGHFTVPDEHISFLKNCNVFYETQDYFFVHGGVKDRPLSEMSEEKEDVLLWIRDSFLNSDYDWGKVIVHGHTPVNQITVKHNRINMDTACVFGGQLSAIELPSRKVYQVARKKLTEPRVFRDESPQRVAKRFSGAVQVFIVKKKKIYGFETLNYNEFGLLIRETNPTTEPILEMGEVIEGVIGQNPLTQVNFRGQVVRADLKSATPMYGVKMKLVKK